MTGFKKGKIMALLEILSDYTIIFFSSLLAIYTIYYKHFSCILCTVHNYESDQPQQRIPGRQKGVSGSAGACRFLHICEKNAENH